MGKIYINDLRNYSNKEIILEGFVDDIKDLKYVQFIILRDHTGKVQITIEKNEHNKKLNEEIKSITIESTIRVKGILRIEPNVKLNGMEIFPNEISVITNSNELPIDYKNQNVSRSIRHDFRYLDLRNQKNYELFVINTLLENALRQYCIDNDFVEIHSPKITAKAAESGSEVFKLDYFGQEAALSQSPQFYKQMAIASGFDKVFEIGPAFRAEKSDTSYHASEINMFDAEIAWVDEIIEVENLEEELLKCAIDTLYSKKSEEIIRIFNSKLVNLNVPMARINFYEAKELLKNRFHYVSEKADDLDRKEELLLGKFALESYNSDFIFVEGFPFSSRAFYQKTDDENITKSYDLLFRGVEITTGALREYRMTQLIKQINEKGIPLEDLEGYLELFKYGCPSHGGFGLGLSRTEMKLLNIENIMDTVFIYRGATRKLKL